MPEVKGTSASRREIPTTEDAAPIKVRSQMGQFGMVPVWVMSMPITDGEFRIYSSIRSFCDVGGDCYPTAKAIAERARAAYVDENGKAHEACSVSAVRNAVAKFRKLKMMTTEPEYVPGTQIIRRLRYHLVDLDPRVWDVRPVEGGVPDVRETPTSAEVDPLPDVSDTPYLSSGTQEQTSEQTSEQTKKSSSHAPSSSSSADTTASSTEDDEDDAQPKIKTPRQRTGTAKQRLRDQNKQKRRDDARKQVLAETQAVDDLDVKALAAFYEQDDRYLADDGMLYLAGVIERDGIDKASEHLDEAIDTFSEWIDKERRVKSLGAKIGEWLDRVHPKMSNHDKVLGAVATAVRAGAASNDIIDAINDVNGGRNSGSYRSYLAAISVVSSTQKVDA